MPNVLLVYSGQLELGQTDRRTDRQTSIRTGRQPLQNQIKQDFFFNWKGTICIQKPVCMYECLYYNNLCPIGGGIVNWR